MPGSRTSTQHALWALVEELRSSPLSRALFHGRSRLLAVLDLGGTVVEINDFGRADPVFRREAVVGEPWWSTPAEVAGADWERSWRDRFAQMLTEHGTVSYDVTFTGESGEPFAVRAEVTTLRDAAGEPLGFLLEATDVDLVHRTAARLREQERLRQLTFDQRYQLTAILGPDGEIRDVNAALDRLGWDRNAVVGRNIVELSRSQPDGDVLAPLWEQRIAEVAAANGTFRFHEVRPLSEGGVLIAVDCALTPVRDATGELEFILFEVADRTASYLAEAALAESEARFRDLAESLPQMIWAASADDRVTYFSPRWEEFTGRPVEALLGRGFMDLVHPDDRPLIDEARMADPDLTEPMRFRMRRHDGEWRWLEAQMRTVGEGDDWRLYGGSVDVTDRLAAEADARAQQEYLRATLELTGYGTYTWYVDDDRFSEDSQLDEILGIPRAMLPDGNAFKRYFELVHPDDRERCRESVLGALVPGGPDYRAEFRIFRPGPEGTEERWVSAVGRTEFDGHGHPIRLVGVFTDFTERRHEDDQRLRLQKLEAMGTLASGVAHDFNNVIGAILSNARVAEAEIEAGASPAASIGEIARGAIRAGDLVKRLLTFGREEETRRLPFRLEEVVDEACALLGPALGAQIAIEQAAGAGLPVMIGDPTQLHQVIVNLVTNAGQAIGERPGRIVVSVDEVALGERRPGATASLPPGDYLRLRVRDDGPGMSAGVLGRVFDPFFTTKGPHEGTGIGLAATQSIIRNHGGVITAESRPGSGALFTAYLPADDRVPRSADEPETTPPVPESTKDAASPHVLFVDDEDALVRLAYRAMPYCGCTVSGFTDPRKALAALTDDPAAFDALVTDLSMPGMTGLELTERARRVRADLPVVMTSGYMADEDQAEAKRHGVDSLLPKPCSIDELAAEVQRLLAR